MQTKNIIFDLGGVLLNIDINKTREAYKAMGLQNIEEYFRLGHASSFFKDYEKGIISDNEFIDGIEKLTGGKNNKQKITGAWNAMLLDFPRERVNWLKELKNKYRLFLFSNTNALHLISFQQSFQNVYGFPMDDLFERAYYSHVVQVRKPDAAAYELVLNENRLLPAETVFIDDAIINVEAANKVSIRGIFLEPGVSVTSLRF
jgi:putative hydrolase of the HAD superfamily